MAWRGTTRQQALAMLDLAELPTPAVWWGGQQRRPTDVDDLFTLLAADT